MIVFDPHQRAIFKNWPDARPLPEGAVVCPTEAEALALSAELPQLIEMPPVASIESVTRRQLLRALNQSTPRVTFAAIESVLPNLGLSEVALEDANIDLHNAQTFERNHSLVPILQAVFSVDDAWCDEVWRRAATL